jgi:hypothetical protein
MLSAAENENPNDRTTSTSKHCAAMRPLFAAFVTFLVCGCANVEYTTYCGRQQN